MDLTSELLTYYIYKQCDLYLGFSDNFRRGFDVAVQLLGELIGAAEISLSIQKATNELLESR